MQSHLLVFDAFALQSPLPRPRISSPHRHACGSQTRLNYSNPNSARCKAGGSASSSSSGGSGVGDYVHKNSARREARARGGLPSLSGKGCWLLRAKHQKGSKGRCGRSSSSPNGKGVSFLKEWSRGPWVGKPELRGGGERGGIQKEWQVRRRKRWGQKGRD